ncbi:hypothetical protein GE061_009788 [Apolygus lucorum]|uniref:Peptidase S1 domain-containing protein n=1 Tax=Apolygus lucorum TaxID=248454 RepID=A0A8S9Y2S2_APOLU|nr:hypothetical protein GE061_009788 [Apolygus lucorum]
MGLHIKAIVVSLFLTIFNVTAIDDNDLTGLPKVPPAEKNDDTKEQEDYVDAALNDPSKRKILDPEWSSTLANFTNIGLPEDFQPPSPLNRGSFADERIDWTLTGLGEVPYAALLFDEFDPPDAKYSVEDGRACGGILVTPKRVMTSCSCVAGWLVVAFKVPSKDYAIYNRHGIGVDGRNPSDPKVVKIRLNINAIRLDPKNVHTIIDDPQHTDEMHQYCYECINIINREKGGENVFAEDLYILNHAIAILTYEPRISRTDIFIPWPPKILEPLKGYAFEVADSVGFGYEKLPTITKVFHDDFGFELNTTEVLVSVRLSGECNHEDVPGVKRTKNDYYQYEIACAYVSNQTSYQLCAGLLGGPVVRNGVAYGMMSSQIGCKYADRKILIRPFYQPTYRLINFLLDKELLELGIDDPKNYLREDGIEVQYLEYEVVTPVGVIFEDKVAGQSRGSHLTLSNSLKILINFLVLFTRQEE